MSRFAVRICPNFLYNYRQSNLSKWIEKTTETPTYFYETDSRNSLTFFETREKENKKSFFMSYIYDQRTTQIELFEREIEPLIDNYIMKGFDVDLVVFGSDISGKRYSVLGPQQDPGLLYLSAEKIFKNFQSEHDSDHKGVFFSSVQIEKEVMKDNLNLNEQQQSQQSQQGKGKLSFKEDPKKGMYLHGQSRFKLNSPDELIQLFNRKSFKFGQMNIHNLFTLTMEKRIRKLVRSQHNQDSSYYRMIEKVGRLNILSICLPKI